MNIYLELCLLLTSLTLGLDSYSISIYQFSADGGLPKELSTGADEGLFLYWRPTENSLTSCNVTTPTIEVNMFQGNHPNFIRSSTLPFEEGYCCVKVRKITVNDSGTWHMWASTTQNEETKYFNTQTNVTVVPPVIIVNRSISILESTTKSFTCGNEKAIYCRMRSPKGVFRTYLGPCEYTIYEASKFDHEGIWLCSFAVKNFVREFKANVELKVVEDETKELILKEMPHEYILYCRTPKDTRYSQMCQITTPYGMDLYLTPGKVYGRYTYYGSKPGECGVTIPKPLARQDIGPWKCQLINSLSPGTADVYGGYMIIGTEHKLRSITVPSKKLFWTPGSSYNLLCHVPYIIEYCWFKSPNGTIYNIKDGYTRESSKVTTQGFKFGDCALSLNYPQNATGKWTCNIGLAKESVHEISETVEVSYSNVPIFSVKKEVSAELGSNTELGCQTGDGKGIKYCRLIRPDGIGLSVDPTKNNSEYSYSGLGFIFGQCGITIHDIKEHDIGKWSCAAKLVNDYTNLEYTTHIELKQEKGSLIAVYIVVGIGGLFSLLGTSYFVMKKFEFNINYRRDDTTCLIEREETEQEEETSRSRLQRVNDIVRFIRKRSPRPQRQTSEPLYI